MKTYVQPLFYTGTSIAGLVIALLSEGWGDSVGLFLIATPLWPLMRAAIAFGRAQ